MPATFTYTQSVTWSVDANTNFALPAVSPRPGLVITSIVCSIDHTAPVATSCTFRLSGGSNDGVPLSSIAISPGSLSASDTTTHTDGSDATGHRIWLGIVSGFTPPLTLLYTIAVTYGDATPPVPCPYGTELADPGTFVYYLTPALIDALCLEFGAPWAAVFFTPLYFTTVDARHLCSDLPPPLPEVLISTFGWSPQQLQDLLFAMGWWFFCKCKDGTPTPVEPPKPPLVQPPGMPTRPTFPCDPAALCDALVAIQKQLAALAATVGEDYQLDTLLQRFSLPFASVPGAVHAGLTGDGSFPISRAVGVKVDVTSHVADHPDLEGVPPYVWDQGWISVVDGDGLIEEKRVSQTHMSWMPRLMQLGVTLGYSFRPGTTATITELLPEP